VSDTEQGQIRAMPNGPFVVEASVPLSRRAIVKSEHGEPLTYTARQPIETEDVYALCRCGGSSNKPFCDGTHNRNGFDGTDGEAATTTYDERSTTLGGTRITIHDDRSICVHAGFCGNRVTNVWKMAGAVDDDTVLRAQAMAMIEKCPSGALTYRLEGEAADLEQTLPAGIAVLPDGPLAVTGQVTIDGAAGTRIETRNRVTLCRCGNSKNKPLCDGTHGEIGFVG
jgi:CDGSH-type Zn-finger protein